MKPSAVVSCIMLVFCAHAVPGAVHDLDVGVIDTKERNLSAELDAIGVEFRDLTESVRSGTPAVSDTDVLIIASYVTGEKDLADGITSAAGAIRSFVARGGVVLELQQRAGTQQAVPWLPKGLAAERRDLDFRILRIIRPDHPVFAGMTEQNAPGVVNSRPVYSELLPFAHWRWRNADRQWGAFREQLGFEVLVAHDLFSYWPALMEAAHGKGRILLCAMALDRPEMPLIGKDVTLNEQEGTRKILARVLAYAASVKEGRASPVRPTVVPEEILDPKLYDIYAGLPEGEDLMQRLYLSGFWKLRKLPDTMTPAEEDPKGECWTGGEEIPENDTGLKEKFWEEDYDDSQWPEHFVPWEWNKEFPTYVATNFGGVGWYRRTFRLPDLKPGARVVLHFEFVGNDSTVWINGQKAGSYSVLERHPGGIRTRGIGAEDHEYDITGIARPGEINTLVVRVFANGLQNQGPTALTDEAGGIWQPVWVDLRPSVYAEHILVTPRVVEGKIDLECRMRNTLSKDATLDMEAVVKPWRSYRYTPPVRGERTALRLPAQHVTPGRSALTFDMALRSPVTWDIENPFLYHLQLYAMLRGKRVLIGQTRFGFREITIRNGQFYINGKRLFLAGVQTNEPFMGCTYRTYNINHCVFGWYRAFRDINIFYNRYHSGHYPEPYYDVADEIGFMICDERLLPPMNLAKPLKPHDVLDWGGFVRAIKAQTTDPKESAFRTLWEKMSPETRQALAQIPEGGIPGASLKGTLAADMNKALEALGYYTTWLNPFWLDMGEYPADLAKLVSDKHKRRVSDSVRHLLYKCFNHPSIIQYSLGNEHLSNHGAERTKRFFPANTVMYDLYKRFDRTRPVTACSGSNCIIYYEREGCETWPKQDYVDFHYTEDGSYVHFPKLDSRVRGFREKYRHVGDADKPFINGESTGLNPRFYKAVWRRPYRKLTDTLPDLDRDVFLEIVRDTITEARTISAGFRFVRYYFIKNVGIRNLLARWQESQADMTAAVMEAFRRQGEVQVGFNMHALDRIVRDPTPSYARTLLEDRFSPVFLCCDLFDRNGLAGQALRPTVYAINDSMHDETRVRLETALLDQQGEALYTNVKNIGELAQGRRLVLEHPVALPEDLDSGHYALDMKLFAKDKLWSSKSYPFYVLGKPRQDFRLETSRRIAAYFADNERAGEGRQLLERLKISFTEVRDFSELDGFDVLIMAPQSTDNNLKLASGAITKWLQSGGRVLCLDQGLGGVPFIPGLQILPAGPGEYAPILVDVIVPGHPAFTGLKPEDWKMWNSRDGTRSLCNGYVLPLNESLLAVAYHNYNIRVGMAIAEVKVGDGICLLSQIDAVSRYGKDSVATRYLQNLFEYALAGEWTDQYARAVSGITEKSWDPPAHGDCFTVDLRSYCNMGFEDTKAGDKKGGWTDDGPRDDLLMAPVGRQIFMGLPFDVIKPRENSGKSCVVLKGRHRPYFPEGVHSIKIDRKAKRLFFLVTGVWIPNNKDIARIVFHYEPGGAGVLREYALTLTEGKHMADWTKPGKSLPAGHVAWMADHPRKRETVAFYLVEWENPLPFERVVAVDFIGTGQGIPILVAISGEKAGE